MAGSFADYQERVNRFNNDYGLNFSYEAFQAVARSNISPINQLYIHTFTNMFEKALFNFMDRKIPDLECEKMLSDYKNLMDGYKAVRDLQEDWVDDSILMNRLRAVTNRYPDSKQALTESRYRKGELRIRDMIAYNNHVSAEIPTPEKLSVLQNYANALRSVNQSRSRFWRIIHPFRNRAERIAAENMEAYVNSAVNYLGGNARAEVNRLVSQDLLPYTKSTVSHIAGTLSESAPSRAAQATAPTTGAQSAPATTTVAPQPQPTTVAPQPQPSTVAPQPQPTTVAQPVTKETVSILKEELEPPKKPKAPANPTTLSKWEDTVQSNDFKDQVASVFTDCLKNSPDSKDLALIAESVYDPLRDITEDFCKSYDSLVANSAAAGEIDRLMGDTARTMFAQTYRNLQSFKLPTGDRLAATQRITDFMINHASPVAFTQDRYRSFGAGYAIEDQAFLMTVLKDNGQNLSENALTAAINNAKKRIEEADKTRVDFGDDFDVDSEERISEIDDDSLSRTSISSLNH